MSFRSMFGRLSAALRAGLPFGLPPSNRHLREALDAVKEGCVIWDKNDCVLLWNNAFLKIYPEMRATMRRGLSFAAVVSDSWMQTPSHPFDTREQMIARRLACRSHLPSSVEIAYLDGRYIQIDEHRTPHGTIIGLYSDVTERHQARQAIAHGEDDLRAVLRLGGLIERSFSERMTQILQFALTRLGLEAGAFVRVDHHDHTMVIEEVISPANIYQRGQRFPLTNTYAEIVLNRETPMVVDDVAHYHAMRGASNPHTGRIQSYLGARVMVRGEPYGVVFFASSMARPLAFAVNEVELVKMIALWVSQELANLTAKSAQAQMVEAAELAHRSKGEFLANMSHELRTPLNAIIGFSDVMTSELFGPLGNDKYREYAQSIYESGEHLLELINDILDVSKLEAAHTGLMEEDLSLTDLCASCLRMMQERAEYAGIRLSSSIASDLPSLWADNRRLKQVLINLLSNAIKFTPVGGSVEVTAQRTAEGGLRLRVMDNGIGMRPEDIPTAFTPFKQIDNSASRRHEGTGLGLPLARSLVELHGGSMTLRSAPQRGTEVSVWLPPNRFMAGVNVT